MTTAEPMRLAYASGICVEHCEPGCVTHMHGRTDGRTRTEKSLPLHIDPPVSERARDKSEMDSSEERRRVAGGYCCDLCRRMERE